MKNGFSGTWFRFVAMEMRVLLFHRRWLLTIVFIGFYSAYAGLQIEKIYLSERQPLLGWQLLTLIFGGPLSQVSVMEILKWVSIPAAFLLTVGEPFSELAAPWNRLVIIRMPDRRLCWWGKVTAWYGTGLLFTVLAMGLGVLVEMLLLRVGCWELSPSLTLGDGLARGSSSLVITWVALGLLSTVWWYTTLFFASSLVLVRPGIATVVTIIVGYMVTITGANATKAIPYIRPALGATLNALRLPGGIINSLAFNYIGLSVVIWLAAGMAAGYFVFRSRLF